MEEFDCKKCLHEKVCALWASRESQNASCFCTDGCDYFTPTLTQPNEPRMINADKLAKRIAGHSNYHGDSILAAIYCAAEGKESDIPIQPIETQPNEPLTCEGCYYDKIKAYVHCSSCSRDKKDLYRRPPEGEADA